MAEPSMTEQPLTDDEKMTLKSGAFGAAYLVSEADPGFFAAIRESIAASGALVATTGLVKEVLTTGGLPALPRGDVAAIERLVLPALGRAVEILRAKAPEEVAGYRTVVIAAAEKVAHAAGGVNASEAAMIAKIRTALGVPK